MTMFKILASLVLGILGPYMMWRGKKTMDTKMIIWGAVLLVASYFLFSGGDDDKITQSAMKSVLPTAEDQLPIQPQITPTQQAQ